MEKLAQQVERLMVDYPYGSQTEKAAGEVVIPVKLFQLWGSITWWLSEYDATNQIAFGYVTGFIEDEWWSISIAELEDLQVSFVIEWLATNRNIPAVELDSSHKPVKFKQLPFNKDKS